MAKRAKKTFQPSVVETLEPDPVDAVAIDQILNGIPIAGDDILGELLDATSDRTVEPQKPAVADIIPAPDAVPDDEPLAEDLGEETGAAPEFVELVENIRDRSGVPLEKAEEIAKRELPQHNPLDGLETPENAPVLEQRPFTATDSELNTIAAEELIDWYDVLQSVLAVWAYDHFSTPKKAVETVEGLYPKVSSGKANSGEKALFEKAQEAVLAYSKRKASFAEQVTMSESLKQRTVRLLDKILDARQIRIAPEVLLGFLLLTPLVVNGGKILLEKIGFENADSVLDKFTAFVNGQEKAYWSDP
ncbi:MAG: hypothetical protein R3D58_06950 [Saprospiraceae bacterium]|nr:hypothetical protein [Lewinellaceae bacterium]